MQDGCITFQVSVLCIEFYTKSLVLGDEGGFYIFVVVFV